MSNKSDFFTISNETLSTVAGGANPLPPGSTQLSQSPNVWRVPWASGGSNEARAQAAQLGTNLYNGGWNVTRPTVPGNPQQLQEGFFLASPRY